MPPILPAIRINAANITVFLSIMLFGTGAIYRSASAEARIVAGQEAQRSDFREFKNDMEQRMRAVERISFTNQRTAITKP